MQSLVIRFLCVIAAVATSLTAVNAQAGTATANMAVQIVITASCTINAASLNFGSNAGTALVSTDILANTTVSVTCTNGSPYAIGMDNGANASGSQRRMKSGSNFLNYNLYLDIGNSVPWTTATAGPPPACTTINNCSLGTGTGSPQSVSIYGKVPSIGTAPPTGTYTDTVTMTIAY
jgi:spore coat protein U-like protein